MLTGAIGGYVAKFGSEGDYRIVTNHSLHWNLKGMNEDGIPSFEEKEIVYNSHKLTRPIETPVVGEHFCFSYGKLLEDVNLSEDIKYLNDFDWLQQLLTMKYKEAGYRLYASA